MYKKLLCMVLALGLLFLASCKKEEKGTESSVSDKGGEKPGIVVTVPEDETSSEEEKLPNTGNFLTPDETGTDLPEKAQEKQKEESKPKETKKTTEAEEKKDTKTTTSKATTETTSKTTSPKASSASSVTSEKETPAVVTVDDDGTMTFGKNDPNSPWSRYVADANPKTGISWDGKSKIIYTYKDGSTGTEPVVGSTYEVAPGMVTVLSEMEMPGWEPEPYDPNCSHCGKKMGDGKNGTCVRWLTGDIYCPNCGTFVPGNTCHTCP